MYTKRIQKIQNTLKKQGIDALFVSNPLNIYYICGFKGEIQATMQSINDPTGFLLITPNDCFLLTDARYQTTAKQNKNTSV